MVLRTLADKLPVSTTVMHRLLIGNYRTSGRSSSGQADDLCSVLLMRQHSTLDDPFDRDRPVPTYYDDRRAELHVSPIRPEGAIAGVATWLAIPAGPPQGHRPKGMVLCHQPGRLIYRIAAQLGLTVKGNTEVQISKISNRLTSEQPRSRKRCG